MTGKRGKRGKGKGKVAKRKGNLPIIDEVGTDLESFVGAKQEDQIKSPAIKIPVNPVAPPNQPDLPPSRRLRPRSSNGRDTTTQDEVDESKNAHARKRNVIETNPSTSHKALRPNFLNKFFPKDSLLSVTDGESRYLQDEDDLSGEMEKTREDGESPGSDRNETLNEGENSRATSAVGAIQATSTDGKKLGNTETVNEERNDLGERTASTKDGSREKSETPTSNQALAVSKAKSADASATSRVLSTPEIMRRDATSLVLHDRRRDSNYDNRKEALLSLADRGDDTLPHKDDFFETRRKEAAFPFRDVYHSTPLQQLDVEIEQPELSMIWEPDDDSEMELPRSLLVISSQIVPPQFSDEEQLRDCTEDDIAKCNQASRLIENSFGDESDDCLVKSLKPIKRKQASGKGARQLSSESGNTGVRSGKTLNQRAESEADNPTKTDEDKGKGDGGGVGGGRGREDGGGKGKGKGKGKATEKEAQQTTSKTATEEMNSPSIPMELELIDPNQSPGKSNALPNEVLVNAKKNKRQEKRIDTNGRKDADNKEPVGDGKQRKSQQQQQQLQQPGPSRLADTKSPIIIPTSYVNQRLPQPSCSKQIQKVPNHSAFDPYAPDDEDDDAWGLESFAARIRRNSSLHVKKTFHGGRVAGMDAEKVETAKGKKTNCPGYFSPSTLEFGREMEEGSAAGSSDDSANECKAAATKKPRVEKKVWTNEHLPLVKINVESDDDECFLCKYKMKTEVRM